MTATIECATREIAQRLVHRAGYDRVVAMAPLTGGKNNRVCKVVTDDGQALVLKQYFTDARDNRDRLTPEWTFLKFAWDRGLRTVPKPILVDPDSRCGLYGFVHGRVLQPTELRPHHVEQAAAFVVGINEAPRSPGGLPLGSEACFSVAQHLATVDLRIARLSELDRSAPQYAEAAEFVALALRPAWDSVRQRITSCALTWDIDVDEEIPAHQRCVSPSDFGFHNAIIKDNGEATFIDFEYAGIDDPAKLVGDFFCQPAVPVPLVYFEAFIARLRGGMALSPMAEQRCRLLLDAYRIKWLCIIMNDFLPVGAARRAFADDSSRTERCAGQLRLAHTKLNEIVL